MLNEGSCQSLLFDDLSRSDTTPSQSKPSSPLPPRSPQLDKFPELLPFAFTIARLFVSEVRQRASNKHAEDASLAILQYLNATKSPANIPNIDKTNEPTAIKQEDDTSNLNPAEQPSHGWNLLLSLNNLISSQSPQIIQLLCDASLPSTLIKCLYLFFDLPATIKTKVSENATRISQSSESTSTSSTRDLIATPFVRAFTQLLVQLCSHQSAIDELIKRDDLRLLVGIASSQCSSHNRVWRKTAFQALLAISKNMRDNFMYLEQNLCVQVYVDNINRINSLGMASIEDIVDMIRVLLGFLYNLDVNNRNQPRSIAPLIEHFKSSRILELYEELLFKIDETIVQELGQATSPTAIFGSTETADPFACSMSQQPSVSSEVGVCIDEYRRNGKRLVHSLTILAKICVSQESMTRNTTLKPLTMSRFEMLEQFKMPRPSARDCILNNEALRIFKLAWSKCQDSHIIEAILDATISLFNDDKYNYFIFESQQLLVYYMTSSNFNEFPCKIKQKLFKFLEFIIIETNYIPCLELGTLGAIMKSKETTLLDSDHILALRTMIACLRFDSKFSDIFREIGLLEVIIELLIETMQDGKLSQNQDKLEVLYLLLEASQYLLAGPNNQNCTQFNESGAARYVFNCLSKPKFFHLFLPPHSSSSDDGGAQSNASRNSTPTPTALAGKIRQPAPIINTHWAEAIMRSQQHHHRPSIKQMQKVAFTIIRQLILSNAGDEHLANLLGLLARNVEDLQNLEQQDLNNKTSDAESGKQSSASNQQFDITLLISQEVNLKIYILKSLMIILKDSHRCRALFRKVGGFIYIVSALSSLEGALPPGESPSSEQQLAHFDRWRMINSRRIWRLIKNTFMTIVVAMRSEPSNLHIFSEDVMTKFTDSIRKLGCFVATRESFLSGSRKVPPRPEDFELFKSIFLSPPARDFSTIPNDNMRANDACCQLFRFLYDMALDMADGTSELEEQLYKESGNILGVQHIAASQSSHDTKSISFDQGASDSTGSNSSPMGIFKRRSHLQKSTARPPSLDLNSCCSEPAILTFPCIILSMLDLVPSCPNEDLMIFTCMIVKSLFKHERNQQMLCEAGMITKLMEPNWRGTLIDKKHFLHELVEFMFEKLTKQAITPYELRMFLRLGEPLCCKNLDEIECNVESTSNGEAQTTSDTLARPPEGGVRDGKQKEKILTSRIETFVAMMSDERSKLQPPFVEFDMSSDGCSSIFMPSIAPVNAKSLPPNSNSFLNSTLDVHTSEKNGILGGVGTLERKFPPPNGLTFSSWICIEKFPARSPDANHNIRLLTIYRGSAATGKEYSCFRIQISALDRALIVSTQETLLFDNENRSDGQHDPDCYLRVWTPETLLEGKWHHVAVTMSKTSSSIKQGNIHVYIDGALALNQRICYISDYVGSPDSGPLGNVGPGSAASTPAAFVNAFIGSLPQFRFQLKTRWKQGPCHLLEESLSANFISLIFALGPNFIGNFQSSNKISDLARFKSTSSKQYDSRSHQQSSEQHRQILHQQSVSVVQSSPRHGAALSRVSSSNVASSSSANHHHHHHQSGTATNNFHIAEDRILMNLDARSASLMTLSRMRRIYTRFDCRQISRVLGLAMHENSTPILLLHNTGVHLNQPSCGIGAVTIGYDHVRCFVPSPTEQTLFSIGGSYVLLGLVAQAQTVGSFYISLKALLCALICNPKLQAQMDAINGYQILTVFFWKKKQLLNPEILTLLFSLITDNSKLCSSKGASGGQESSLKNIQQVGALRDLICDNFDLWLQMDMINLVLEFIHDLISSSNHHEQVKESNSVRTKNLKCLRDMDLLPRLLRLLPRDPVEPQTKLSTDNSETASTIVEPNGEQTVFDSKAVYLIKQTVFELINRTPRQADILYFGQFLASLLPAGDKERSIQTVNLRNVLLKSLLQMMTKNKQKEVNDAMQEELVRILGFDWFILFITGPHLDVETITLGFFNMSIILSNDDLYANFKNKTTPDGGWLKEPTFPTIDGKFNIQLLGINVGVFLGLNGKRKAMCQEVLEAPNFHLLDTCLTNLVNMPRIYLMIFQTMMGRLNQLDSVVFDTIGSFDKMTLDILCDCLIGDTHHKRRQTLASIKFRGLELVVSLVHMIGTIMRQYKAPATSLAGDEDSKSSRISQTTDDKYPENYPTDIIRFFMYLYNNNVEFQSYCKRSEDLIDALCDTLMVPEMTVSSDLAEEQDKSPRRQPAKQMTCHPASKEVLELSRLIIMDRMTEIYEGEIDCPEQLLSFERFLDSLGSCREAQGELVDMLLRQVLLMIDSTARHNSIKTIGGSENVLQFQLLLMNSISVAQIVTDKIWSNELFQDNISRISTIIDHQLCLAEQIFKFNEILPKHSPPHAFIMQRVLNRTLLFAISRPVQHMSDKILMLDLLKKIHDNRTIIILNHMHSPQSAEFFVCFTYWLIHIMEENLSSPVKRLQSSHHQSIASDQPASLIERQYGHPSSRNPNDSPSSSGLMLVSLARKVWDAIYQSKKGVLSEAFDVSLSLPAFTLDTSLDLIQLKPDINDTCERYWSSFIESEQKPKRRIQQAKHREQQDSQAGTASAAVNLLSGRLTRVVNAASFVSRVVGATAGTMASNVNLVGEKLTQTRGANARAPQRSPSDVSSGSGHSAAGGLQAQASGPTNGTSNQQQVVAVHSSSRNNHQLTRAQIQEAHRTHISIIDDYIKSQLSQKNHKLALHKYLCDEWLDTEYEILLRERALFGPDYGSRLEKWCLDLTEGPRRMRKKMVNNTRQFYENYAHKPDQYNPNNKSMRYRPPMSYDSIYYYQKTLKLDQHLLDEPDKANAAASMAKTKSIEANDQSRNSASTPTNETKKTDAPEINVDVASPVKSIGREFHSSIESLTSSQLAINNRPSPSSPTGSDCEPDDGDSTSFVDFSPEIEAETNSARESENTDSLSVLRLLEKNERISHMFRCSRVQGLDTYEGLLLFGREHFYLIDGFTLLKTREIKDIDRLPPDAHDPIIPNSTPNILAHSKKTCAKFSFDRVVEVHKRRYLLQPIALEVFSSDGRNTLIVFPRSIRNKVYSRLMTVATQITNNAQDSLAGQKSNVSVEGGSGLLSNLIGETSVTQRWVRGELSNFQYLMNLNTIAGRSYNDLMQYPIFPWILNDYTSDYLDLSKAASFRDLSRPVGAQTSDRLEQFKRRYAEWDDTETPPYHYGTFYSSAMIVASYMVRMEPFTQHFLRLQGGHFDLADRMFHSIADSWMSASKHNMADIKELIPEFFYLPEFLVNENKYDLGLKQNGQRLDNVILPPWAKNDAREFIRQHRCALESDYVSAHLHEWIDLIFGYKQQGQPAVDAVNVFHHLFYEGNVDIYNTDIDPIKKNAVIGFINNFGQVPKQLFKKPHPARKVTNSNFNSGSGPMPLTPILPSLSGSGSTSGANLRVITRCPHLLRPSNMLVVKDLRGPVGQIVQVDKNVVAVEQNKLLIPPEYCRYVAWGHADRSLRLGLYDSEKPMFVWEGSDHLMPNEILCCTIPNSRTMITAGTESLITVWKIERMRSFTPIMNLYGHVEPVTCLASSQSYSLIVSGSRDRTAIIWDLNRLTFVRQLGGGPKDKLVHNAPISAIAINDSTGDIATCASSWLYLWTINGELLAKVDSFSVSIQQSMGFGTSVSGNMNQVHILSVCFSQFNEWDSDELIITGTTDGSVAMWSMRYFQSPEPVKKKPIQQASKDNHSMKEQSLNCDDGTCTPKKLAEDVNQPVGEDQSNTTNNNNNNDEPSKPGDDSESNKQQQPTETQDKTTDQQMKPHLGQSSEPIAIRGQRQRTDTMNSEWVRLSASSASTTETIPVLRATPTSPMSDMLTSSDFLASGESFNISCEGPAPPGSLAHAEGPTSLEQQNTNDGSSTVADSDQTEGPTCSTPVMTRMQPDNSPRDSQLAMSASPIGRRPDRSSLSNLSATTNDMDELDGGQSMASKANLFLTANDPSLLKFSKSDTSLVDSFVILGDAPGGGGGGQPAASGSPQRARPQSSAGGLQQHHSAASESGQKARRRFVGHHQQQHQRTQDKLRNATKLQPGYCWKRELYLRMALPRRQGKTAPAAVTSLAISKDHKTLYVGDSSGRITGWTTT